MTAPKPGAADRALYGERLEALRPLVSGARALAAVETIATHHRIQATQGYEDAATWLLAALADAGLRCEPEVVPGDGRTRMLGCPMPEGWSCTRAVATLHGAHGPEPLADFAAHPLSLIQRSSAARGRFPLVAPADGGLGDDAAVTRGAVLLTNAAVQRVHEHAVVRHGAAGLLSDGRRLLPPTRTDAHDRDSLAYTSFWWQGDQPRGWGFVVTPERGAELRARLAAGERLEIEVAIESGRHVQPITLVSAVLPGTLPGEVLLTSHLCHPRPGANDNASGVAATLEAARALAAAAAAGALPEPRRSIRFLWMPEFTGTYAWLAGDPARAARTIAALNLDMVGADQDAVGSTLLLECAPHFAASFAEDLLAQIRTAALAPGFAPRMDRVRYSGGSDHALWLDPAIGVPCPMLIQWPDRYYHSDFDTPDRCDPRSLAHAALTAATYAAALATLDAEGARTLLALTTRAAQRRMRQALEAPEPRRAVRTETVRGQSALASVQRIAHGLPGEHAVARALVRELPAAIDELEDLLEAEIGPALRTRDPLEPADPGTRCPVRLQHSLLLPMRGWQPGWEALGASGQAELFALEERMAGGGTAIDLAWFAADGVRRLGEIADVLAAEGLPVAVADVETLFELTARMGASRWAPPAGVPA